MPIPRDGIRTFTSGIRAHRASDYTTRAGTLRVSSNKHFRHSPTRSIMKHKHALRNTPTSICGTTTAIRRLQGPPLTRRRRVRWLRKAKDRADMHEGKNCPFPLTRFEPLSLGYAPIVLPITPLEQARLASVGTNTSHTHPPGVCVCLCVSVCMSAGAHTCVCVCVRLCVSICGCVRVCIRMTSAIYEKWKVVKRIIMRRHGPINESTLCFFFFYCRASFISHRPYSSQTITGPPTRGCTRSKTPWVLSRWMFRWKFSTHLSCQTDMTRKWDEKFVRVKHACTAVCARACQHGVCTMCRTRVVRAGRVVCARGRGFKSKRMDKTKQKQKRHVKPENHKTKTNTKSGQVSCSESGTFVHDQTMLPPMSPSGSPPPPSCTHHPPRTHHHPRTHHPRTTHCTQQSLADTAVHACFTLRNWSPHFGFWSYPSDDRLWRETLSHGNSEFPRVLAQAPQVEPSVGILIVALL